MALEVHKRPVACSPVVGIGLGPVDALLLGVVALPPLVVRFPGSHLVGVVVPVGALLLGVAVLLLLLLAVEYRLPFKDGVYAGQALANIGRQERTGLSG